MTHIERARKFLQENVLKEDDKVTTFRAIPLHKFRKDDLIKIINWLAMVGDYSAHEVSTLFRPKE